MKRSDSYAGQEMKQCVRSIISASYLDGVGASSSPYCLLFLKALYNRVSILRLSSPQPRAFASTITQLYMLRLIINIRVRQQTA